jgi:hypothetical protein
MKRDRVGEKVQEKVNPYYVQILGRIGLVTRGVIFMLLGGILVSAIAFNTSPQDKRGALDVLANAVGSVIILWVIVIGLYCYALWRLYECFSGITERPDKKRWKNILNHRIYPFISALGYIYFSTSVLLTLIDPNRSGSGGNTQATWSAKVLTNPAGVVFFIFVAIFFLVVGIKKIISGIMRKFMKSLKVNKMSKGLRIFTLIVGVIGYVGKGLALLLFSYLYFRTAIDRTYHDVGLKSAFNELADEPWGKPLLLIVGIGLFAYGIYSIIAARYQNFLVSVKSGNRSNV